MKAAFIALLLVLVAVFDVFSQNKKWVFSAGGALSYNSHYGEDFVPGDSVLVYDGLQFIRYPHPSATMKNSISYALTLVKCDFFPFEKIPLFFSGQFVLHSNKSVSETPKDTIIKYEPFYSPYNSDFPLVSKDNFLNISTGISAGVKMNKLEFSVGTKILFVSWKRNVSEYIDAGTVKTFENYYFVFSQNHNTPRVFNPFCQISYAISDSWLIGTNFSMYEPHYFSFSIGVIKKLVK